MKRLIIETSNLDFQTGIHDHAGFLYRSDDTASVKPIGLQAQLQAGLTAAEVLVEDIREIIVDVGPGGLTSTRSGIAFANGLAFALSIPIVEVNSLELMVLECGLPSTSRTISARRANDGNFFMGFFQGNTCQRLAFGQPLKLIGEMDWSDHVLDWVGPIPKQWVGDMPDLEIDRIDLLSPGLEAYSRLIERPDFGNRARVAAAGPVHESNIQMASSPQSQPS